VRSIVQVGVCLAAGVSAAAAATIGLHASDLDVAELYAGEVVDTHAAEHDTGAGVAALAGLAFSAIDVINPGLDASDVTHHAQEQIQEWTGARTGPFDTNVTLAALVRGSIAAPGEAAPPAEILPVVMEPGSSVAPSRGPLEPEALASGMPPPLAGVVSPSSLPQPVAAPATPVADAVAAPPAPAPVEPPPSRSGPSLLTLVAMTALIVTGATTFAMQSDRPFRRRRHRTPRDF
jgi:hypothetical protein